MRDSVIFYRSFYEAVQNLDDDSRLRMYEAIFEYALNDNRPTLTGTDAAIFTLITPQLDANTKRYEAGCTGGRPKTKTKPNHNQTITKEKPNNNQSITKAKPNHNQTVTKAKPNDNDNDNDNVNDNEKEKGNDNGAASPSAIDSLSLSLLNYLNDKVGSNYHLDDETCDMIGRLILNGYTEQDIRTVIDKKCVEWLGDGKMQTYLRPSTLFGDHFKEYLEGPTPQVMNDQKSKAVDRDELKTERKKHAVDLQCINNKIKEIRSSGEVESRYDELNDLKLQAAIVEDTIANIDYRLSEG